MFSETVDLVQVRSGRPGLRTLADCQAYVRAAIRECQMKALFESDLIEDVITTTTADYVWTTPRNFRVMRTVKYDDGAYPPYLAPGKRQLDETSYFYKASNYFVFVGTASADSVAVAYYNYARYFKYYAVGARPAVYDEETDTWTYLDGGSYIATLGTDELDEAARELVSNWLMERWGALVEEGGLAKIYKNVGDDRAGSSFALYKSMQGDLLRGEAHVALEY